jgi:hypothetical protein
LTNQERVQVLAAVDEATGRLGARWERVGLFGSRTLPEGRGGDIDLYLELVREQEVDVFALAMALRLALEDRIGPRKVDLVIDRGEQEPEAFVRLARKAAVNLWTHAAP